MHSRMIRAVVAAITVAMVVSILVSTAGLALAGAPLPLSRTREEIRLDGEWRFLPKGSLPAAGDAWGRIRVPGSWTESKDIIAKGKGSAWVAFEPSSQSAAWYERDITIPGHWSGRRVILGFDRVSTDAVVWINGKKVGGIDWPSGEVELSGLPAGRHSLRVQVAATLDRDEVEVLMGAAPGQNYTVKATIHSAGLIDEVWLRCTPKARIEDIFIQPSVRNRALGLDMEVSGMESAGNADALIEAVDDRSGLPVKSWELAINLRPGFSRHRLDLPWESPRLWEVGHPHLYRLRVTVRGKGIDDEVIERFGFREFWIEGRHYYLNGKRFNARTRLVGGMGDGPDKGKITESMGMGFNLGELWPHDTEERTKPANGRKSYELADEMGFPLTGLTPHMDWMGNRVNTPEKLASYAKAVERVVRRDRNHPSILMWGTSGNMFGGVLDPAVVGQREKSGQARQKRSPHMNQPVRYAADGIAAIRRVDPTRPVFIHHGGDVGDVYTINHYLNMTPLQEREEWLTAYAEKGDMPLWYVEFGTPVGLTLLRGRNGFHNAMVTEPFLSEYCAMYLGADAYRLEPAAYRALLAAKYTGTDKYDLWWAFERQMLYAPSWLKLQELFIGNTWRSWRTTGMSGGMIPWDNAYAEHEGNLTVAGEALKRNNSDFLAWICGPGDEITDKTHNYWAGERIRKNIAVLNDSREPVEAVVEWEILQGGIRIGEGKASAQGLEVGGRLLVPIDTAAAAVAGTADDGVIQMSAMIGGSALTDEFAFRVFPREAPENRSLLLHDVVGHSERMLAGLGYDVRPWDGASPAPLLVIGRESMPVDIETCRRLGKLVWDGARLLVLQQKPELLSTYFGFRVCPHQARRAFMVYPHPVTHGLAECDLTNWAGVSTLLEPYPDYVDAPRFNEMSPAGAPMHGWRWGNRHAVSSAAIEKPHRSGWRPILEVEFDLAYSPLMELDFGRGRVILCQLDLEDHAASDPVAARLACQLISYAAEAPEAKMATSVTYLGDAAGADLLRGVGARFRIGKSLPEDHAGVTIVGGGANVSDARIEEYASRGGRVVVLPQPIGSARLGALFAQGIYPGGYHPPPNWPQAAGVSPSDLRVRSDIPMALARGDAAAGVEVAAGGMLARRVIGDGVIIFCQADPHSLGADDKTYLRLTRWRHTRLWAQLLANMGVPLAMDRRIFDPMAPVSSGDAGKMSLAGEWHARLTLRMPASPSPDKGHPDPGISDDARLAVMPGDGGGGWETVTMPMQMEHLGDEWRDVDGEAVFRKSIKLPPGWQGMDLVLALGTIDDNDDVYVNGIRVGGRGDGDKDNWSTPREYRVPAKAWNAGDNLIAVRVWDRFGGGGITGKPADMSLVMVAADPLPKPVRGSLYHSDYREEFDMGDDPYRYYNW